MKSYEKMVIIIVIAIILTIIANIFTLLMLNNSLRELKNTYLKEPTIEENVLEVDESMQSNEIKIENTTEHTNIDEITNDISQEVIETEDEEKNTSDETPENSDNAIGTIKIPKINFEGTVYEGTSLDILAEGVGHFDNSPYLDGNVCLAAHNTSKFWAKLKNLKKGDSITYESFLGTREYKVSEVIQIDETDWTKLENTNENMLTLITCVKGVKPKRLCVRATEI